MGIRERISGNEAIAYAMKQINPDVMGAYPITPSTEIPQYFSTYVDNGEVDTEFIAVESEHSAMAAALGASMMGARTFTASSSQGLLYMCEMLSYVSGARHPVVMADANRSTATPWNIYGDQRDAMAMRDSGFVQLYVESGQEALDTMLMAYRLAEDPEVMLPVMVNLDGFTLTHTYDLVDIPDQADVDRFLPPFQTTNKLDMNNPMTLCATVGPAYHTEGRIQQCLAFETAKRKIQEIDAEFGKIFGRTYHGMYEEYCCEDADLVLVASGSVAGTTRVVVDELRGQGRKVGMIKLKSFRPFPKEFFASIGGKFKALGVIDKSVSFGYDGTIFGDVKSSMYGQGSTKTANFICGLGGRDISKDMIAEMFGVLQNLSDGKSEDEVQFIGKRW